MEGEVVREASAKRRIRGKKDWITGIAFSPYDSQLYVCNYEGKAVQLHDGITLKLKRDFCKLDPWNAPEGLTFHNNAMFVAMGGANCIMKFDTSGYRILSIHLHSPWDDTMLGMVPWGLRAGYLADQDHLFVATGVSFQDASYNNAPPDKKGYILEVRRNKRIVDSGLTQENRSPESEEAKEDSQDSCLLDADNSEYLIHRTFQKYHGYKHEPPRFSRPSGIWVMPEKEETAPDQNRSTPPMLLATSVQTPLVQMELPSSGKGNITELVGPTPQANLEEKDALFDVCVVRDQIWASVHAIKKKDGRLHVYSLQGKLQRIIRSPKICNQPNMMDVQW